MAIQIGQRVRISDDAYPNSDEPDDVECRGQTATVVQDLSGVFGSDWGDCAIVVTDDGYEHYVIIAELEALEAKEN